MTNHPHRDQRQLEQATLRSLPPGAPLDDDTAALRDGWLSLSSTVDRANADFREEALLIRLLAARSDDAPARPAVALHAANASRFWPALLASALALTMLLAVSRTLWQATREHLAANLSVPPESELANGASGASDDVGWPDSLDEELDDAADQVRSLIAQATRVDASLSILAEQLDSMSSDLMNDSL